MLVRFKIGVDTEIGIFHEAVGMNITAYIIASIMTILCEILSIKSLKDIISLNSMTVMSNWGNIWPLSAPIKLLHPSVATVSAILAYVAVRFIYRKYFYPRFFTPIKHIPLAIPEPPSRNGKEEVTSSRKLITSLMHAVATVPNNGLLRYYGPDTNERVLVTGVKALNDILVLSASSFVKPESVRRRLYVFGGEGLLLAEGEAHKVFPSFSELLINPVS